MAKVNVPFLRTPYNYDTLAASDESGIACEEASLAQQQFKDECDINNILRQFNITGELPNAPLSPKYGDFTGISDYKTALDRVIAADEEFMNLPATLRARFDNDAANLIAFLDNEENRAEAEKLGLTEPKQVITAPAVEESTPTPPESA
ncbi:minor capsid protein [Capybara microvirus Cap3_SP_649]|nr:minor capsid protein [Capybara microvirus Cap3_SP_649]